MKKYERDLILGARLQLVVALKDIPIYMELNKELDEIIGDIENLLEKYKPKK